MKLKREKSVRLPEHIIPRRYNITLKPDLENFTFEGEETIALEIKKSTKEITLHAIELEILSASLAPVGEARKISYDEKAETATILFNNVIPKGEGKLHLKFTGILNDKIRGFYRSRYVHGGKHHHIAVTQFESTDARRAIPSFDEPSKKAVFDVNLIIPQDHTAISNTIETEIREHSPGYKIVTFEPTPKMSTYLLAFIVGRFEHLDTKTKDGVLVRVFATPGKKHQAAFALETAKKCLEFYENYFGIKYPLPALDLIAIPDFASGAMENWGAVTYRETALLFDEELSSTANKQWVALVIAHELAHMWFGNLVTMEWWTHLWLNEGFASYIEYLAVDHLFPDWDIWSQFVYMDHSEALELDGLKNTHAIEIKVHHPSEISEIFDAVSYSKGASIIRMLAAFLGEKDFKKGLRVYLNRHKYANASTENLWEALEKVSKKPIKKMMRNWTGKPGYPLITVSDYDSKLKLTQSRYFSSPLSAKKSLDKTIWSIPLDSYLFSKKSMFFQKPKDFLKLNKNETSFVRVNYPSKYLLSLKKSIGKKILSSEDRFGLIRDAFMLSQSAHKSTADFLNLVSFYKNEDSYIVWAEIASDLRTLENLIFEEKFLPLYKKFSLEVFKPIAKKLGWDKKPNESHTQTLLRHIVLFGLGASGDEAIVKRAKDVFKSILEGKDKIDSDLRGIVYNLIAENGGSKEYGEFKNLYQQAFLQEEKDRILRALCGFKNIDLIRQTLEFAFSKEMRAQDQFKAVGFVFANPMGRNIAWDFLKKHWREIVKRFGGGHLYSRFIKPASSFVDKKKAKEIEDFFKKNLSIGLDRTIAQVTEQIRTNSEWLRRDRKKILNFLNPDVQS